MAPTKRGAGDQVAPPPAPGKRLRATEAAPGGSNSPEPTATEAAPGGSNPLEPSPSPGKRFRAIVFVVLFFRRPKGRNTDSVPVSLDRIRRTEMELRQLHQRLGQVRDTLGALLREQEHTTNLIQALTSRLDNIIGSSPNHHNHEQLAQGTKQDGNNVEAEGLATTENEGNGASIRLRFLDEIKPHVYHGDEIKSIRIGIFDGDTLIESGMYSKVEIEVLALEGSFPYDAQGSWTPEEFREHIAYVPDGEENVLEGKGTKARLANGECHLGSIKFKRSSCRARNRMFVIGARIRDGQEIGGRVQEAIMNPVVVHDRRNKYNGKSNPPSLNDAVYRLKKIAIKGEHRKRLAEKNIFTVEHLLKTLYKDEDNLAKILQMKKECEDWNKLVKHAQECDLEGRPELKSYRCEEKDVVLFFNCVHRVVGAKFGGPYISSDNFKPEQKNSVDKLKRMAYDQLDGLMEDYIMRDNIPVPIDTGAVAGPSCTPSAPQRGNPGHHFAVHQVGGTPATEILTPHAPTEPNNNAPDPHSTYNYQAEGVSAVEDLSHGLSESPLAAANYGPGPGLSVPDRLRTQGYQGQGTPPAVQEQDSSAYCFNNQFVDSLYAQAFSFAATDAADMLAFLQHQAADTNNYMEMQMQPILLGPGSDDSLEALMRQQFTNTAAPGSAQGSLQGQTQAPLPNNGIAE